MWLFDRFKPKAYFPQLGLSSDCHCHLLPGVDDGVKSLDESVSALHKLQEMGLGSVVLTPHIHPDVYPDNSEESLKEAFAKYLAALPEDLKSSMAITLGAEYMVVSGFEERDMTELLQFKPGKVLIEMSYLYASTNIENALFAISMAGLTPVIAHPERYQYLTDSLSTFERYHDMGAEFQMNLLSLSGAYGPGSMRILRYLSKHGWYSHLGTDAHSRATLSAISHMQFDPQLVSSLT